MLASAPGLSHIECERHSGHIDLPGWPRVVSCDPVAVHIARHLSPQLHTQTAGGVDCGRLFE